MVLYFQAGGGVTPCPKQEVGSPHVPAFGPGPPQKADDDVKLTSDGGQFQRGTAVMVG